MYKTGDIKKVESEHYGTYNLVCIGLIDMKDGKDGVIEKELSNAQSKEERDEIIDYYEYKVGEWIDSLHPKEFFGNFSIVEKDNTWCFYVFVPLLSANTDWHKENPDCKYFKQADYNEQKELPIGISQQKVDAWIKYNKTDDLFLIQ